jgi:signal peptide peptidase SppA, 36K type
MQDFNNQNNQDNQENQNNPESIEQNPTARPFEQPIPEPFSAQTAPVCEKKIAFKSNLFTNTLITFLICVFSLSFISAAFIIFRPTTKAEPEQENKTGIVSSFTKGFKDGVKSGQSATALIKIRGVIQESQNSSSWNASQNASVIAARIRELAEQKNVHSLLLDINSPGGTVASVQDIYNAILYFKGKGKPVVALFRDVSASGGYYIATAADKIVAQPGTITGSIGVIMQGMNIAPLLDRFGITVKPIKSAKHKDIGSPYREMTEEEQQLLQDMINDTYMQFFNAVKNSRKNIPEEKLRLYADGRVWTGSQAKALGFVDELGGTEKAKEVLEQLTGEKDIKIKNIGSNTISELGSIFSSAQSKLSTKIEDISTPKVSYLWTY